MSAPVLEPQVPQRRAAKKASLRQRAGRAFARATAPRPARASAAPGPVAAPVSDGVTVSSAAFTMLAIVCLWGVAQLLFFSCISQNRAQDLLYHQFRSEVAAGTASLGPTSPVDSPVAMISIPALGVEQIVVEGTASSDTQMGPGHQRNTVLPGQAGTSVVLGRAATYGAPFAHIGDLRAGDTIRTVTGQGKKTFTVIGVRRAGDPYPQPRAADAARLTLVSAEGSGAFAALAPDQAVYVDAEATKAFPAPAGLPSVLPESEQVMSNDTSALPLLALCLALLLAATLAVVAARQRWSAVLVWVVAAPLVIALSWATTDVAARLLPNAM